MYMKILRITYYLLSMMIKILMRYGFEISFLMLFAYLISKYECYEMKMMVTLKTCFW